MFHLGNDEGCEADVHGHGGVVSGGGVVEGDDRAAVELVDLRFYLIICRVLQFCQLDVQYCTVRL